ncbi:hypothetical protein [Streptomyces sp. NPDC054783]
MARVDVSGVCPQFPQTDPARAPPSTSTVPRVGGTVSDTSRRTGRPPRARSTPAVRSTSVTGPPPASPHGAAHPRTSPYCGPRRRAAVRLREGLVTLHRRAATPPDGVQPPHRQIVVPL